MVGLVDPTNKTRVGELHYAVSTEFAFGMFNSCRDVINPSSNQKALDMLCGMDASHCTPDLWLDFMGNPKKNPLVPFPIHYHISNDTVHVNGSDLDPMQDSVSPCNESCSCQDCAAVCRPVPPVVPPKPCTILGIPFMYFIMGCTFMVFVILFGTLQVCLCLYSQEYSWGGKLIHGTEFEVNGDEHRTRVLTPGDVGCCEKVGAGVERGLERLFCQWGLFCARHYIIVLVGGFIMCGALSAGIAMFQVTTDPVELWSAPDSRARQEKDYFDENFT